LKSSNAKEERGRDWIGIGVTQLVISLIKHSLQDTCGVTPVANRAGWIWEQELTERTEN